MKPGKRKLLWRFTQPQGTSSFRASLHSPRIALAKRAENSARQRATTYAPGQRWANWRPMNTEPAQRALTCASLRAAPILVYGPLFKIRLFNARPTCLVSSLYSSTSFRKEIREQVYLQPRIVLAEAEPSASERPACRRDEPKTFGILVRERQRNISNPSARDGRISLVCQQSSRSDQRNPGGSVSRGPVAKAQYAPPQQDCSRGQKMPNSARIANMRCMFERSRTKLCLLQPELPSQG